MGQSLSCSTTRARTDISVRDLDSVVQTGDIILFSSKHAGAKVTKFFTASTWDHIGLVVRFPTGVYILEYAGGVYLYPLFTRLYTYYAIQGRLIALRRLLPGVSRDELQSSLEHFVRSLLGQKPPSIAEVTTSRLGTPTCWPPPLDFPPLPSRAWTADGRCSIEAGDRPVRLCV
jgi:hypothetical protein